MKLQRDPQIIVNICWQIGAQRKCATMSKEHAYATRDWVEKQNGTVTWFQAFD